MSVPTWRVALAPAGRPTVRATPAPRCYCGHPCLCVHAPCRPLNPTPQADVWVYWEPVAGEAKEFGLNNAATIISSAKAGRASPLDRLSEVAMKFTGAAVAGQTLSTVPKGWPGKDYFVVRAAPFFCFVVDQLQWLSSRGSVSRLNPLCR